MSWILIITTLVTLLGGSGVAIASNESLPGDFLYPVKTTFENFRLVFSDDEGEIDLYLNFAENRLEEIEKLITKERYDDVTLAVENYNNIVAKLAEAQIKTEHFDPSDPESSAFLRPVQLDKQEQALLHLQEQVMELDQVSDVIEQAIRLVNNYEILGYLHINRSPELVSHYELIVPPELRTEYIPFPLVRKDSPELVNPYKLIVSPEFRTEYIPFPLIHKISPELIKLYELIVPPELQTEYIPFPLIHKISPELIKLYELIVPPELQTEYIPFPLIRKDSPELVNPYKLIVSPEFQLEHIPFPLVNKGVPEIINP